MLEVVSINFGEKINFEMLLCLVCCHWRELVWCFGRLLVLYNDVLKKKVVITKHFMFKKILNINFCKIIYLLCKWLYWFLLQTKWPLIFLLSRATCVTYYYCRFWLFYSVILMGSHTGVLRGSMDALNRLASIVDG